MSSLAFPFPSPYDIQIQARTGIEKSKRLTFLEMPTGTGKTVVLLLSLLGERQVHYYCQSHDQADIVIQEINRINEKNNTNYTVVHMAGRSKLCVAPNVMEVGAEYERVQTCKVNRIQYNRGTIKEFNESCSTDKDKMNSIPITETAITLEVMNNMAIERKLCPRTIMAHAVETADVIVMPYNYLVNPHPSMQTENCIAILDEAHGIDSKLMDLASIRFDSKTIESLRTWCKKNSSVGVWATSLAEELFEMLELFQTVGESVHEFKNNIMLGSPTIFKIFKSIQEIEDDAETDFSGFNKNEFPASLYQIMGSVTEYVALGKNKPLWKHHIIVFDHNFDNITMRVKPLTPAFAIRKYLAPYKQIVMASGTLTIPLIRKTLRMKGNEELVLPSIHTGAKGVFIPTITVDGKNVSLNTLSSNRGTNMWRNYAKLIKLVSKFTPNGMLCFSPSYRISEGIRAGLQRENVKFPIFNKLKSYMNYMDDSNNQALFISSFRGAGSEGFNFPDHYARAIFLCGLPRLPPTAEVKRQVKYYNDIDGDLGKQYEMYSAMIPVAQAYGRGVRHPNDWCVNYFLDTRYNQYQAYLPSWVRSSVNWDGRENWVVKIKSVAKFVKGRKLSKK